MSLRVQCWPSESDSKSGPRNERVKGVHLSHPNYGLTCTPSKQKPLIQCWIMLGQRRRRWVNIGTTLDQGLLFIGQ